MIYLYILFLIPVDNSYIFMGGPMLQLRAFFSIALYCICIHSSSFSRGTSQLRIPDWYSSSVTSSSF